MTAVVITLADDDKVFAVPADVVDAGHADRDVARVREPRFCLELELLSVHAGWLRTPYRRAIQMQHAEGLEARERGGIFVL